MATVAEEVNVIVQKVQSNLDQFTDRTIEANEVIKGAHQKVKTFTL
ncbi:hypothetical protein [Pseudobacillus wudalianchiensis]|nr:hypothetical protein [Bacillus wudalianchiensis]